MEWIQADCGSRRVGLTRIKSSTLRCPDQEVPDLVTTDVPRRTTFACVFFRQRLLLPGVWDRSQSRRGSPKVDEEEGRDEAA